jgi:6-phosphogluconolactonase
MTFSKIGRIVTALVASAALGLGMTACGGGTIGYMWVLGNNFQNPAESSGEITGYKIDDFTGNLTAIEHSPFESGGSNPQMLVVKPGGRFIYVINSGVGEVGTPGSTGYVPATGSSISEFSVGSGGILTFQNNYSSQGTHPLYVSFDGTGSFLYVLDKYSKYYGTVANGGTDLNGSITAFSVASDTGRLTLIPNTTILTGGLPSDVFEVGPNPIMSRVGSGGCLYTLSANEIFPYIISSSNGQLTLTTTGPQIITNTTAGSVPVSLTSINTSTGSSAGSFTYLTDGANNAIYSVQAASTACSLSPIASSQQTNVATGVIPMNSLTSANGKFLYVINQGIPSTTSTQQSSISAFTITSAGVLQTLSDGTNNPYATGSGPLCIVEDPSNQYLYISNNTDSTVTGKLLDQNRGFLADLTHGSTFPVAQLPTCLAVSGNI